MPTQPRLINHNPSNSPHPVLALIPLRSSPETLGRDLESFAHHAARTRIEVDDVRLAARSNAQLYTQLETAAVKQGLTLNELKSKTKPPAVKPRAQRMPAKKKAAPAAAARKGTTLVIPSDDEGSDAGGKGKGKKKATAKKRKTAVESSEEVSD